MVLKIAPVKWAKQICVSIFAIIFSILGMTLFVTVYSVFSFLCAIYRLIIILIAKIKIPSATILRPLDGIMTLRGDIYRATHNYITLSMIFEGELNIETFREGWMERVMRKRYPNGKLQFPQFQQFVRKFAGYNFWVWDESFDIKNYIFVYQEDLKEKDLVDKEKLIEIRSEFQRRLFPKGHGVWEILIIPNYKHNNSDKKHSVIIFKLHHALGDGFASMKVFWVHLAKIPIVETQKENKENSPVGNKLKSALQYFLLPFLVVKVLYKYPFNYFYNRDRFFDNNPWHTHTEKSKRKYELWIPKRLNKDSFREIRDTHGVNTMSIITTIILGGIRKMMVARNLTVPKYMRVSYPIPLPNHPDYLTNHARIVEFLAPVSNPNPSERLIKTYQNMQKRLYGPFPIVLNMFTWLAGNLPYMFHKLSADYRLCSVYIPCVPLPPGEVELFDCRLVATNNIFYTTQTDCGAVVSCLGLNDHLYMSLQVESSLINGADELKNLENYILEELQMLRKYIVV